MANAEGQFELKDNAGSTVVYGGPGGTSIATLTTSDTNVPTAADKIISGYQIQVLDGDSNDILISFDDGTTHSLIEMKKRNFRSANLKGDIKQLKLKTTAGTIADSKYELIINFEDY